MEPGLGRGTKRCVERVQRAKPETQGHQQASDVPGSGLGAQGGARRVTLRWHRPQRPSSSLTLPTLGPSSPGFTSESNKGNSEGFLEPAPRGLSVLGRSERGREGQEKGGEESKARQRARVHL